MKVYITGQTEGLGKALLCGLPMEWDIEGRSRRGGLDISISEHRRTLLRHLEYDNTDVLINNAYDGYAQVELLYEFFERFKDTDKMIINIGSNSSDGIKTKVHPYAVHKAALDKACEQLQNVPHRCRITNIRFGWLDTYRIRMITDEPRIPLDEAIRIVQMVIDSPPSMNFNTITVVPPKPNV